MEEPKKFEPTLKDVYNNCMHQDSEFCKSYRNLLILHNCIIPIRKIINETISDVGYNGKWLIERDIRELLKQIFPET